MSWDFDGPLDPKHKRLALSRDNFHGSSLAALGVAAHEAGHAIQHQQAYAPQFAHGIGSDYQFCIPAIAHSDVWRLFLFHSPLFINLGIGIYIILTIFQLVTLPVEFDASKRAKLQLANLGIIETDEMPGVTRTLDAAAYTYVAAFVSSLGWLLYLLAERR